MTQLAAIARLVALAPKEERRDGDLLAAFLHGRDEAAFAELIRRHGPMVWGVCRRSLPDVADAEDAFQAAFLVLVRKSHQLTRQTTVGPWLYRVAAWTARNLRRKNARRLSRTMPLTDVSNVPPREPDYDLDAALLALPEKYRTPLVLCHLIGLSRREAALQLGCPEGTLSARLSRALAKLRIKLLGQDPLPMLAAAAGGIVPASLATATERTAIAFALASLIPTTAGPAAMLAEGVLRMFWIKKAATTAIAAMMLIAAAGMMIGVAVQNGNGRAWADDPVRKPANQNAEVANQKTEPRRIPGLNGADGRHRIEVIVSSSQVNYLISEVYNMQLKQLVNSRGKDHPEVKKLKSIIEDYRKQPPEAEQISAPFAILEKNAAGDVVLSTIAWEKADLGRHLARLKSDPNLPSELVVSVSKYATIARVEQAIQSVVLGGFQKGRIGIHADSTIEIGNVKAMPASETAREYDVADFSKAKVLKKDVGKQ